MGFNTTIVVHNDALDSIENDPDFGKNLARAIKSHEMFSDKMVDVHSKCHCNAAEVIESHHADQVVAVAVGGNMGEVIGYAGNWRLLGGNENQMENHVQMLKNLADRLGYNLHKQPKRSE